MSNKSLLTRLGETLDAYYTERRVNSAIDSVPTNISGFRHIVRWLTPNGGTILLILLLIFTQNVWARTLVAPNAPGPTTINYQGRLANPDGTPVTDGSYGITFALYDAATAGNVVWGPESHAAVQVSGGLFSVGLGSQTAGGIPTSTWNGDRYLEITINGEALSPRELIRGVPVAGMALTVPDGSITQAKLGDDISYTTETSGTYEATLTVTEGTNPTITPNTVTLTYKRIGSIVFVSVPLFFVDITGNPHVIGWSLPFPPEVLDKGGEGTLWYSGGSVTGVIGNSGMTFREWGAAGFPTGSSIAIRGGFWYIAAP